MNLRARHLLTAPLLGAVWLLTGGAPDVPAAVARQNAAPAKEVDGKALDTLFEEGVRAAEARDLTTSEQKWRAGLEGALAAKDNARARKFLFALGRQYEQQRQLQEARTVYEQALTLGPEKPEQARLWRRLGTVCYNLSDLQAATTCLTQAGAAYRALNEPLSEAETLRGLGEIQARMNDEASFAAAEQNLKRAQALFTEQKQAAQATKCLSSLGDAYRRASRYDLALKTAFQAREEARQQRDEPEEARNLDTIGNTFHELGQNQKARLYYEAGLKIRERRSDPNLSFSYNNLGVTLLSLNRNEEALAMLQKGLELRRRLADPRNIAQSQQNIGRALQGLGRDAEAERYYQEALPVLQKYNRRPEAAGCLYKLGDIYLKRGDLEKAWNYHQQALELREQLEVVNDRVTSRIQLALIRERQDNLPAAETLYLVAVKEFEDLMQQVTDPAQVGAYRETTHALYPRYARTLFKQGKLAEALQIAERARGVGLMRQAALSRVPLAAWAGQARAQEWQDLIAKRAQRANRLRLALQNGVEDTRARAARADYEVANQELNQLRDVIFAEKPPAVGVSAPRTATQLRALTERHPETLFLEWVPMEDNSTLLFALSAQAGLQGYLLPVGEPELEQQVSAWRAALAGPGGRGRDRRGARILGGSEEAQPERPQAQALYAALFGPLDRAGLLRNARIKRLALVTEGPLLELPFAALCDAAGRRLIERYALRSGISLESLLRPALSKRAVGSLLCIADPFAPGERRPAIPGEARFGSLKYARQEGKEVAALYPGARCLEGNAAREAQVKRLAGERGVLHFATHGMLFEEDAMQSGVLLSAEPLQSREDGLLQAWEIAGLRLEARLAVLSACETARGEARLGEGLQGLTWAFQAAGCRSVVASQWSVDDAATREVMVAFHKELRRGRAADFAMQAAMRSLLRRKEYAYPYFWAAFQVIGDGGPIR